METALDQVITAKEAAVLLDKSKRQIQRMCSDGKLIARPADGTWLILKSSVYSKIKPRGSIGMELTIIETGEVKTLTLIDAKSGQSWIKDFIGNADGFGFKDGVNDNANSYIVYDKEEEAYYTSSANFDWWEKVVSDREALDERIKELSEKHGPDAVQNVLITVSVDLEHEATEMNAALDEAFTK